VTRIAKEVRVVEAGAVTRMESFGAYKKIQLEKAMAKAKA